MRGDCPESIAEVLKASEVLTALSKALKVDWRDYVALVAYELDGGNHPFAVLVGVILSQNTNDRNSIRAYLRLREEVGVDPHTLSRVEVSTLEEVIRVAGLAKQKARAVIEAASKVVQLGGEGELLRRDWRELRDLLTSIPGVGKKTADVFLSLVLKAPVFAVDTHAFRVAERWGLASGRNYERTADALLKYFGPERSEEAHRLIIALGREYCRARNPKCPECPLLKACPHGCRLTRGRGKRKNN